MEEEKGRGKGQKGRNEDEERKTKTKNKKKKGDTHSDPTCEFWETEMNRQVTHHCERSARGFCRNEFSESRIQLTVKLAFAGSLSFRSRNT